MKMMPKRVWVLLTAIVLVVGLLGMTAFAANTDPVDEPVCFEHGDVNSDGQITGEDAVYLLYASFGDLFGEEYMLSQDGDLDGDGEVTGDDAVYLLYASFGDLFLDQYPLKGTVHSYYDPIWSWNTDAAEPTVQVSLKCACGQSHIITEGIAITAGTVVEPTCVAAGSKEYSASVTYEDTTFETTFTVTVPAKGEDGHTMVGEPTCEKGVKCLYCDYTIEALGHSYVDNGEKVDGCKHTKLYKCACGSETQGDVYYTHSYTAELVEEATCTKAGKKLLTCVCGDTQEETVPVNPEFHVWGEAVTENGVTTQTCACGQTKTVVVMSDEGVSADALKDSEVQLEGGTSVALDENTAEQLDSNKTVVIKVEQVDKNDTAMSEDKKNQIGDNAIYDFSMQYSDGTPITNFEGEVTVCLPYTLQEGDDVNTIDVWYIADNGSVECVKGVYSNNYVTFKTDHFSYYTVTRLTPEQRCAVYGHAMVERKKDATCTEDGYHKIFCQRCGLEEKNEVKAMLGHNYQKDDTLSVDATCSAPGKLATQCANCGHKRLQEVKQLSHKWSVETVAATCSGKGYDKRTCDLCGLEKIDNEKEALGHNYLQNSAVWSWNDDHSKATVTLTCANDKAHTKELSAVITAKGGSVCVGGEVTYTATASFNKVIYTDSTVGEVSGTGHTPNDEWSCDKEYHYHICSVCGDPVGKVAHNWDREVTTAATCGKEGAGIDTCTVCGEKKSVIIPATGEHTYKNGVCTGCGHVEGSCDHKKLTEVNIDLSEYGTCGGNVKILVCECGKIKKWNGWDTSCNLEDEKEIVNEEQGYIHYASSCSTCGLRVALDQNRILNEEECSAYWKLQYNITVGDTLVIDTYEETTPIKHPMVVKHAPVNLADYGLCERTMENTTCLCGLRSSWDFTSGDGCDFAFDEKGENFTCATCGANGTVKVTKTTDKCETLLEAVITYYKNNEMVFTYTDRSLNIQHDYVLINYELNGETCSDGVSANYRCVTCGETVDEYYTDCIALVEKQVIDTSATNSCTTGIRVTACPCGKVNDWEFVYDDENTRHQWSYSYDEQKGYIQRCSVCNFCLSSVSEDVDPSMKDKNCRVAYNVDYTYTDGQNNTFTWTGVSYNSYHNYNYEFELQGDSCEDGVKTYETCADCGLKYEWEANDHQLHTVETLILDKNVTCGGVVCLAACPCGKESEIFIDVNYCNWEQISGDQGFEESRCSICGTVQQIRWEDVDTDAPCTALEHYEYTYLKNDEVLGTLECMRSRQVHRYIYELTFMEGATTCDEGFVALGTCMDCGKTVKWEEFGCYTYIVSREQISAEGMCGEFEIITERCACGRYEYTYLDSLGDTECHFYSGDCIYNEEYGMWQYFCTCGASRINTTKETPIEGETCKVEIQFIHLYFAPNGDLIAETGSKEIDARHSYICQYQLLGETCDDGWKSTRVCQNCGVTRADDQVHFGCQADTVAKEVLYNSEDICGPVYLYQNSCACGKNMSYSISTACRGTWSDLVFTCRTCGLQHTNDFSYERIPDTCLRNVSMTCSVMRNGQTVGTVTKTYTEVNHKTVCQLILLGETCEDGYRIVESCVYCDYEYMYESVYNNHELHCTEYYEAPEGSCGGYIRAYSCACGKKTSTSDWLNCEMYGQETYITDENGIVHTYWTGECQKCGMTENAEYYSIPGPDDCHLIEYISRTYCFGDWEHTINGSTVINNHDWMTVTAELKVPGSQSCTDGVSLTEQCVKCGEVTTWNTYDHYTYFDEANAIDLASYGSVCGAKLVMQRCTCGKYKEYVFSDDTQCDIGKNWTTDWIDGVLDGDYYTTNGWKYIDSNAYERYCAVTDPACGLRIRMARYWLNEDCMAVEYQTWQLGYDPETKTCQKEITIATGNRKVYHNYVEAPEVEGTEDGMRTLETKYTCADCGSYYYDKYYFENDIMRKQVREAINMRNDGNNKRYTQIWVNEIFVDIYGASASETALYRNEVVFADGSEYWQQMEYTYDFANGCNRTIVSTDSNGDYNTQTSTAHSTSIHSEWIKESTCTQSGILHRFEICHFCGEVVFEEYKDRSPSDHRWSYSGDKQTYVCSVCGLENQNGISGAIWLEDLSTEENYVVGYYNNGEVSFNPYVSLILYDAAEGENDEVVLDSIVVSYLTVDNGGIRGLSFSKAATAEAAAAALQAAGYTGHYAVRISCVPINSTDTLDYAVTFNTLTAE